MKNSKNSSGVAGFNCNSGTQYVIYSTAHKGFVSCWTQHGWKYELTNDANAACQFGAMTTATLIGFCLGLGSAMRIDLVHGQPSLL